MDHNFLSYSANRQRDRQTDRQSENITTVNLGWGNKQFSYRQLITRQRLWHWSHAWLTNVYKWNIVFKFGEMSFFNQHNAVEFEYSFTCAHKGVHLCFTTSPDIMILAVLELCQSAHWHNIALVTAIYHGHTDTSLSFQDSAVRAPGTLQRESTFRHTSSVWRENWGCGPIGCPVTSCSPNGAWTICSTACS